MYANIEDNILDRCYLQYLSSLATTVTKVIVINTVVGDFSTFTDLQLSVF